MMGDCIVHHRSFYKNSLICGGKDITMFCKVLVLSVVSMEREDICICERKRGDVSMAIGWQFPSNNFGTLNGIGEAGIETFKGTPYRSLAREICQNSLDAKVSVDKPVRIEFSYSRVEPSSLIDFSTLKEAIGSCFDFWKKQGNKKTVAFFKKAVAVADAGLIPILRISDHNTTGLTGSDEDYNTPWQNLVKASGVSDKGGSSGGSFGIGKSAPFACSDLRTVFYATRDINGLEASQGIARLVSFPLNKKDLSVDTDSITTGIGYYGEMDKNRAMTECRSLDKDFQRTNAGTDVFILGFTDKQGWEQDIIISVLDDFLIAIYNGQLEVVIGTTIISKETLPEVIKTYQGQAVMAYNYYQTLVSPDAYVKETDFEGLGSIELYILIRNGLHRNVLMSRGNGMKVFDQKNFPRAIQFAGICLLKDEDINAYFREMENPQHDAWEPERHSEPSKAKKHKQDLFRFIKSIVLELGRKTTVEEVDAEGVGEYLPDDPSPDVGEEKQEVIGDEVKSIELDMSGLKNMRKGSETSFSDNGQSEEDGRGEPFDKGSGGAGRKDFGERQGLSDTGPGFGGGDGEAPGKNGEGDFPYDKAREISGKDGPVRSTFEIYVMSVRLILVDKVKNRYRYHFMPKRTVGDGYLKFKIAGEQGNINVNISHAVDGTTLRPLRSFKNMIYLKNIKARSKMSVEFDVDYAESSSMEVNLYGYKI